MNNIKNFPELVIVIGVIFALTGVASAVGEIYVNSLWATSSPHKILSQPVMAQY